MVNYYLDSIVEKKTNTIFVYVLHPSLFRELSSCLQSVEKSVRFNVLCDAGHFREKTAIRKIRGSVVKEDNSLELVFFVGKEVDEDNKKLKTCLLLKKKPT